MEEKFARCKRRNGHGGGRGGISKLILIVKRSPINQRSLGWKWSQMGMGESIGDPLSTHKKIVRYYGEVQDK